MSTLTMAAIAIVEGVDRSLKWRQRQEVKT
jgi:hypothetical protein